MDETYTVAELSQAIGRALARTFSDEVWVRGEIRDLTRASSGHVYFNLVEVGTDPEPGKAPAAIIPVTLFESDKVAVNRALTRSGAVRMTDGVDVRIRGQVGLFAPRGSIQLRMSWIDTDYTVGKLAARRERLLRALAAEGLLEANGSHRVPDVPLRLGLLTSVASAAFADFTRELQASGYAWSIDVADVRVQGRSAEESILAGLAVLASRQLDVIAIVRGGGAQSDLAAFDSEALARAVASCSIPVFTGIGHEIDDSVVDRVASRSFKTPTACAAGLVGIVDGFATELGETQRRIASVAGRLTAAESRRLSERVDRVTLAGGRQTARVRGAIESLASAVASSVARGPSAARQSLIDAGVSIARIASRRVRDLGAALDAAAGSLALAARGALGGASSGLDDIDERIAAQSPERLFARGWSVTMAAGAIVRHPSEVEAGDRLATRVAGGSIDSIVGPLHEEADGGRIGT